MYGYVNLSFFFRYVDLKKKRVGYPSVLNFEGQSFHFISFHFISFHLFISRIHKPKDQDQGHRKFVICLRGL
jgi:hypothetical protein